MIPLKLEPCDVPDRLAKWQWINYFQNDGYERLVRALDARAIDLASVRTTRSQDALGSNNKHADAVSNLPSHHSGTSPTSQTRNAPSIDQRQLENAVCLKSETEFQTMFESLSTSPIPDEVRHKLNANKSQPYRPFSVLHTAVDIRVTGLLLPLVETRIQIESELRRKHCLAFTRDRIDTIREQLNKLTLNEWRHIVLASYEDALEHATQHLGSVVGYKERELRAARDELLNQTPTGLLSKVSGMLDAAFAQSILDFSS